MNAKVPPIAMCSDEQFRALAEEIEAFSTLGPFTILRDSSMCSVDALADCADAFVSKYGFTPIGVRDRTSTTAADYDWIEISRTAAVTAVTRLLCESMAYSVLCSDVNVGRLLAER